MLVGSKCMDHLIFSNRIFNLKSETDFEKLALELFRFQYDTLKPYRNYCQLLKIDPEKVTSVTDIPFLPIDFFRTQRVSCIEKSAKLVFSSSGTTGSDTSFHEIPYPEIYEQSFSKGFHHFYGNVEDYCILALLPSYLERKGSSLVYMAEHLIRASKHRDSGFYLHDLETLSNKLKTLKEKNQKTLLLGVTYALLDLATAFPIHFPELIVMETGGMKGKRREMIREEVHETLKQAFGCPTIHSEYGMTELLSQAYSKGDGLFEVPPWMRVFIRNANDPLTLINDGQSGGINVIDLANSCSCAFIAVQDLGRKHSDGSFEVLGRFDASLARGCNQMVL